MSAPDFNFPSNSTAHAVECDNLFAFREIAGRCTEEECLEIMEDCLLSDDPVMRGKVKGFYEDRLFSLQRRRKEVEHYEAIYD
jgi:hypothetical protein